MYTDIRFELAQYELLDDNCERRSAGGGGGQPSARMCVGPREERLCAIWSRSVALWTPLSTNSRRGAPALSMWKPLRVSGHAANTRQEVRDDPRSTAARRACERLRVDSRAVPYYDTVSATPARTMMAAAARAPSDARARLLRSPLAHRPPRFPHFSGRCRACCNGGASHGQRRLSSFADVLHA